MGEERWPELSRRFSAVYTGAVTDTLDKLGLAQQTLPNEIRALRPGMRLAGPAFPVEGHPHPWIDYDKSIRRILEMLGAVRPHHVVVYQTHDRSSAHLGELSVTSLKQRGCAGALIDGGCRDVEYILRQDFSVFCAYTTPQDCVGRWELAEWDVPVTIGGVRVSPGDYVVADADGVVIVPADSVDEILDSAEALINTENHIREAVGRGEMPLRAYERYGTF
jgi:4-hydroxy-4-methyl-2-oxoglutarate aldolase